MMRQDYILRLIAELRQFVSAMIDTGDPARAGEALHAVLHAQERLFQRPPEHFNRLNLEEQIELLGRAESAVTAVEKVATYAATLEQAARVYAATNRDTLAMGSRQLALGALLTAAQCWPDQRAQLSEPIAALRGQLQPESLNPVVMDLLKAWNESGDQVP